jgi:hypothetical protein
MTHHSLNQNAESVSGFNGSPQTADHNSVEPTPPATTDLARAASGYFNLNMPERLRLSMQVVLSLVVLLFCVGQIIAHDLKDDKENIALYWGGITSLLAWWMPSPGANNAQTSSGQRGDE